MTKQNQDFEIWQGVKRTVKIPVVDDADAAYTMTSATPEWRMFKSKLDDQADAVLSKTGGDIAIVNLDGTNDGVQFDIDPDDTKSIAPGTYYHEVRVIDVSGNEEVVTTGDVVLHPSPTRD